MDLTQLLLARITYRRVLCAGRIVATAGALIALGALVTLNVSCSEDTPTSTDNDGGVNTLAGGGRAGDRDPFIGGPGDSGPARGFPGIPDVDTSAGLRPLIYVDPSCSEAASELVITDSTAWREWWDTNAGCYGSVEPGGHGGGHCRGFGPHDGPPGDSGVVEPDTVYPSRWELPVIDFDEYAVIAVSLAPVQGDPRMVTIEGASVDGSGTHVSYTIYRPGPDCPRDGQPDSPDDVASAPAVAAIAPAPLPSPYSFAHRDTTYCCSWEPDPDAPLTLYYTDAPCELGAGERIIRTQEEWEAWTEAALDCDFARWERMGDSTCVPGGPDSGSGHAPHEGMPPVYGGAYSSAVDFERFAVIVLRADPQDRWGGGIWLTDLHAGDAGTTIEYVVMNPGDNCPVISDSPGWHDEISQPTAAIRVPLPLPEPISWVRNDLAVDCDWGGGDSTIVVGPDRGRGLR